MQVRSIRSLGELRAAIVLTQRNFPSKRRPGRVDCSARSIHHLCSGPGRGRTATKIYRERATLLLRPQRLQQLDHLLSLKVLRPSERSGPVLEIDGRYVRSMLDKQLHHPGNLFAGRPVERGASPVEARWLRVDISPAVEQIRSALDAAAKDRIDKRLLQKLTGCLFSGDWGIHRRVMAPRTRQQAAISVKEAREQIGPSHACGKFQVQGGTPPHKSLSNLLTLIPYCLGERTPVIIESIHRRARVDEELGQDDIVAARSPLQSRLSFLWVARAGIDVCSGTDQRQARLSLARTVSRPIAQVVQ